MNASMWMVGVSLTDNLLGLEEEQVKVLPATERKKACERIEARLTQGKRAWLEAAKIEATGGIVF